MSDNMVGRKVRTRSAYRPRHGVVVCWEPLSSGMCDALVEHDDGSKCWYGSSDLTPTDGLGTLPDRREARAAADALAADQLCAIQARHAADAALWPGKDIIGRAIDKALAEVQTRGKRRE